jgi:hypothetical protein
MNIGRNDPCPCGSGKKYKKCCLAKDEEAARQKAAAPSAVSEAAPLRSPEPPRPPDPRLEAWNARWEEFDKADYEERFALFQQTLDEQELMDAEMVFEMMHQLFEQTLEHGERDRFDALVEALREQLPEVYEAEAHNLLDWRISNALVAGQLELAGALTCEFAQYAHSHIDHWNWVEGRMAYHGQLTTLTKAMRSACPQVRESPEIVPWGIDEFFSRATSYELLNYVTEQQHPHADDPVLLERMSFYGGELLPERLAASLACLTGQMQREWTPEDFQLNPPRRRARRDWDEDEEEERDTVDQGAENLFTLTMQFVRYAHQTEGVAYSKAELARRELYSFIVKRHAGQLEYRESMFDSMMRSSGHKRGPIKKFQTSQHLLCPDRERLDQFLAKLLDFIAPQHHRAVATLELTPTWLRFLETQGLIDAQLRRDTLKQLQPLTDDLRTAVKNYASDPTLAAALLPWNAPDE